MIPYDSNGSIKIGGDNLPLTTVAIINSDGDGVLDKYDLCSETGNESVNSDGCSCSQQDLTNDCPEDSCVGKNWVVYPEDGSDTCIDGSSPKIIHVLL